VADAPREPGWYPDRNDPSFNRYWNGRAWTSRRHPAGQAPPEAKEPATTARRTAAGAPGPPARKRAPVWPWVIGSLMLVRAIFAAVAAFDHPAPDPSSIARTHPSSVSSSAAPH
jgi:hypothetical protein